MAATIPCSDRAAMSHPEPPVRWSVVSRKSEGYSRTKRRRLLVVVEEEEGNPSLPVRITFCTPRLGPGMLPDETPCRAEGDSCRDGIQTSSLLRKKKPATPEATSLRIRQGRKPAAAKQAHRQARRSEPGHLKERWFTRSAVGEK